MLERNDAQHLRENSGRNVSSDFSVSRIAPLRLMSFLHCQIDLLRYLFSYNFILESLNHKSSRFPEQRSKCEVLATGSKASLRGILPIFERNHAQHFRGTNERNFFVSELH